MACVPVAMMTLAVVMSRWPRPSSDFRRTGVRIDQAGIGAQELDAVAHQLMADDVQLIAG